MRSFLFFVLVFLSFLETQAQDRIKFDYDAAGNQIVRKLCLDCPEFRDAGQEFKDIADLKEEDLLKFAPSDIISYYPNPVKEELYLTWELIDENKVSSIEVYTINGKVLQTVYNLERINENLIQFGNYPSGTYAILLHFTNGEQKSITIIKN